MLPVLLLAAIVAAPTGEREYKQPQVAVNEEFAAVAFGAGTSIFVAASPDRGRSFSKPVEIPAAGMLSLGRHRGPRIALSNRAIVVSAISGKEGRGADGDLLAWRSSDRGAHWSAPVRVNDSRSSAREGLHAMAARGNTVFAAWLDLRSKGTKIFGSVSKDGGATWSKNMLIYESPEGTVCECCHPSATIDADGQIYVMFRNSLDGSRDLYLARSSDGGKSFSPAAKLGSGTWKLNACPMDGGGIAVTANQKPVTVWRRGKELFIASDGTAEEKLAVGKDAAIAATQTGTYAAWTSSAGLEIQQPGKKEATVLDPDGAYAQLASAPDGKVIAAWERQGSIVVEPLN